MSSYAQGNALRIIYVLYQLNIHIKGHASSSVLFYLKP